MPAENRSPEIVNITAFFLVISTVTVLLRVYCRRILLNAFGPDDYFMVIAWICFVASCSVIITGDFYGVGRHAYTVSVEQYQVGMELWYFAELIYGATILFTKISIALYLRRIAAKEIHIRIIDCAVSISTLFSIFFFFYLMFQCTPISYFWTRYGDGVGKCQRTAVAIYTFSALNCLVDFTVALIPWLVVKDLQMDKRTKFVCMFVLVLGSMTSIATSIRIPYLHTLFHAEDFIWATSDVAIWSAIEMGLGITAGSLATLKPLFKRFLMWSGLRTTSHTGCRVRVSDVENQQSGNQCNNRNVSKQLSKVKRSQSEMELENYEYGVTLTTITCGRMEQRRENRDSIAWVTGGGKLAEARVGSSDTGSTNIEEFSANTDGIMKSTSVEIDIKEQSIHEGI